MAELEVAKHTRNVIETAASKEHGWAAKLRELVLEIVVIVFAVSISIWFHSMGEHRHEQAQVKAFLTGLRGDLALDIKQIAFIQAQYHRYDANFKTLAALAPDAAAPADFDDIYQMAGHNVSFNPLQSRYQGFQSSGKLTNIEQPEILNGILNLYQNILPSVRASEGGWSKRHDALRDYLDMDFDLVTGADRRYARITAPMGKRLLQRAQTYKQMYERFDQYAKAAADIIAAIDAAYPEH